MREARVVVIRQSGIGMGIGGQTWTRKKNCFSSGLLVVFIIELADPANVVLPYKLFLGNFLV
jgi:hypothetical protein